jgi:hypothetical protein
MRERGGRISCWKKPRRPGARLRQRAGARCGGRPSASRTGSFFPAATLTLGVLEGRYTLQPPGPPPTHPGGKVTHPSLLPPSRSRGREVQREANGRDNTAQQRKWRTVRQAGAGGGPVGEPSFPPLLALPLEVIRVKRQRQLHDGNRSWPVTNPRISE